MTFEEIGQVLRSEREKQNLSIDSIASKLKISPRLITALEAGDINALPHPAYVRGFIRSYGALLGLDPEEIQSWFSEIPPMPAERMAEPEDASAPIIPPARKSGSSGKGIAVLLILAILGGAAYWLWHSGKLDYIFAPRQAADFETRVPGAADYLAENQRGADASENRKDAERVAPSLPESPPDTISVPIETPVGASPPPVPSAKTPDPAPAPVTQVEEDQPVQHKLIITATEECWIHSNADKTDTRQFSLRKGDTFALTFTKGLELKLGNAGGVRLRYDGKDIGPAGTSGQVKTLTFPPQNN